jgi:nucleotide-binding universal stress UspA family protein
MVLGSVSAEVVDHAAVPVLVARGRQAEQVILAWDGSASASRAAALLGAWPIFTRVRVRVVSVADVKIPWWSGMVEPESVDLLPVYVDAIAASRVQHEQLAGEMAARLREAGLQAESLRPEGDAATQILAAARAWPADIIVLGTHGRTGLARLVLGSVARNVLHHAPCSVLVVREPAAVRSMPDAPPEG